jgi:integrase
MTIAARLQVKGGSFRDLPLTRELSDSLGGWFAFLKSVKGVRLRRGGGVDFAGSALVFPGRNGAPFSNKAFNARIKLACQRARVPVWAYNPS